MRILLLCQSFNSLTQRIYAELARAGHEMAVEIDTSDKNTQDAVTLFQPDLVIAPFLKRLIPESVWRSYTCLIVHPGIPGDGGPSALDWAILENQTQWGVTVLQATGELDGGPIWCWEPFAMRETSKSDLYRFEVTEAATAAVLNAVAQGQPAPPGSIDRPGAWRNATRQEDRSIDWQVDDTATILRKIRSADGSPGLRDELAGLPCRLYDAHAEGERHGEPGELIARREHAVLRATVDGGVWIGHIKPEGQTAFKLAASDALGSRIDNLPNWEIACFDEPAAQTFQDIRYREQGEIGILDFDFYNGAMNTRDCNRLLAAYTHAASRPTRIIVLRGGRQFWSNGLDLNSIEATRSPADESWCNINAMDDLCEAIIRTTSHVVIAAMRGNAGAGGCFMALAADTVIARNGIILNPHYRNMGNLYGSEYWTYLLPRRAGEGACQAIMQNRLPIDAAAAMACGLVDAVGPGEAAAFDNYVLQAARQAVPQVDKLLTRKSECRLRDESIKPLSEYRAEELEHMRLNFYGFDPSYHVARYRFVHHTPHAWTPLYMAPHRRLGWQIPPQAPARALP